MNEELFNKPWARKEDQIEYDPDETVESFARKMQVERKKKLEETYKPTEKEQEVINLLSIPIKNKIKELIILLQNLLKLECHKICLKKILKICCLEQVYE